MQRLARVLVAAVLLLYALSPVSHAQDPQAISPPDWFVSALKEKPKLLEMRISGNRGVRTNQMLFGPAWAPRADIENELWVYAGSLRNRVAKASQIAKKTMQTFAWTDLPPDFAVDEFHVIAPVRLVRGDTAKRDGSGEELLNVAVNPVVQPLRSFEPSEAYRRLLALPPDWELTVVAYAPEAIHAGSTLNVFYTKTKKKDTIDKECLR